MGVELLAGSAAAQIDGQLRPGESVGAAEAVRDSGRQLANQGARADIFWPGCCGAQDKAQDNGRPLR